MQNFHEPEILHVRKDERQEESKGENCKTLGRPWENCSLGLIHIITVDGSLICPVLSTPLSASPESSKTYQKVHSESVRRVSGVVHKNKNKNNQFSDQFPCYVNMYLFLQNLLKFLYYKSRLLDVNFLPKDRTNQRFCIHCQIQLT